MGNVYVVGATANALAVFTRDVVTGALTVVIAYFDDVADVDGLGGALYVTTSADGANVYTASWNESAVAARAAAR